MSKKTFYITTAIPYTSQLPHIGNTYEAILTDAIARFKRLSGYDVFFLTGTDEHGQKVQKIAQEEGITPQQHVDQITGGISHIWDMMNVSYDKWLRTTDPDHEDRVARIFEKLYRQGDIYKKDYEGFYCTPCESFLTETQVVDGKCPDCGTPVEMAKEEAYFFRLSKYADRLTQYINENPGFIQPDSRKNEMINNFIKPGLQDICVSRSTFDWGVHVPFDPKHVVYVWIDALPNYITALGYDPDGNHGELFLKYWPADVHVIGKDILRFHTIYWPAILMALDIPLPKQVFGHPWILFGEDKMSKSKGNVIYAEDLVKYFGVDAIRYYVLHEIPFAQDGTITYDLIISRVNSDLANILGNLVNRTIAMCHKYFNGVVPKPGTPNEADAELLELALKTRERVEARMDALRVSDAIDEIWTLLRRSNKYIDENEPWKLAKSEETSERLGTVLYNLLESIRIAAVLISPFMPETAQRIFSQINTKTTGWDSLSGFDGMKAGDVLNAPEPLFARIDEQKKLAEIEADRACAKAPQAPKKEYEQLSPEISIAEFAQSDLRVGKVLTCEPVPKSDKLLKLSVDLGFETRQIVSGISKWYTPSDLIGKKVVVVANLKPAVLRGIESQGMILAAINNKDDVKVLFAPDDAQCGSKIN